LKKNDYNMLIFMKVKSNKNCVVNLLYQ